PALASLRRLARPPAAKERCELCSAALPPAHAHLIEPATRRLACACDACAVLFADSGAGRYRRGPPGIRLLGDPTLDRPAWERLTLPITIAFCLSSTAAGLVLAFCTSPGGAIEAPVPEDAWRALVEDNPVLRDLEPDVEALLVNRVGSARDCYRVGVDRCHQ